MKVTRTVGRTTIEIDAKDAKSCFIEMANASEIFGEYICGACGSENVVCSVRENAGNTFFEMRCKDCGACLAFGQRKSDGALFPRRKDTSGNWLENNGWVVWKGKQSSKYQEDAVGTPF